MKDVDSNGKECLVYKEDVSKCHQGGIKSIGKEGKVVYAYHNEQNHEQCLICLYEFYVLRFTTK